MKKITRLSIVKRNGTGTGTERKRELFLTPTVSPETMQQRR